MVAIVGNSFVSCSSGDEPEPNSGNNSGSQSNNEEWVDLGLPSGTLWATKNIGAKKPEDFGSYFAWGETTSKDVYNWESYKYSGGSWNTLNKYCVNQEYGTVDNKRELENSDDAATVNWGKDWQMPTPDQIQELINGSFTYVQYTEMNGVYGWKVTGKVNEKSIFFPKAYIREGELLEMTASGSRYWSRKLTTTSTEAYSLEFYGSSDYLSNDSRYKGLPVRAVRVQKSSN